MTSLALLLLFFASTEWPDYPRDIPSKENFTRIVDALAKGLDNNLQPLHGTALDDGRITVKDGLGLAPDPEGKRYWIDVERQTGEGEGEGATATFLFWTHRHPDSDQQIEAARYYQWMAAEVRERFPEWERFQIRGGPSFHCGLYNPEGKGHLTVEGYLRTTQHAPKGLLVVALTFSTERRVAETRSNPLVVTPEWIVYELESLAAKNWMEVRWTGRGLVHPDGLHKDDNIVEFNGERVHQGIRRIMAEKMHDAYRYAPDKTPVFKVIRGGVETTVSFRPEVLDTGEYEGRVEGGIPTGPGRQTLHNGTVIIARFQHGWPAGLGYAVHKDGRVARVWYEAGVPGPEEKYPAVWNGETLDGFEHGPVLIERGTVVEESGPLTTLRIDKLGTYKGTFIDGMAQGEGILVRPNGDLLKVECLEGIMKVQRALKVVGPERMACFEANRKEHWKKLFTWGDLLSGDARDGTGVLFVHNDRNGAKLYTGGLRNGVPHGPGKFQSPSLYEEGTYEDGERHGRIYVKLMWPESGKILSESTDTYNQGKWVLPPEYRTSNKKTAPRRRAGGGTKATRFTECWTCNMRGYVHVNTWTTEGVSISPFQPGSPHYGSWIWTGTKDTSRARRVKHTERVPCQMCGGDGKR